jgi:hypothetical protein
MESRRGGRIRQRESVEQVYVVACGWVCERLAGGVDGVCRDAVWCEEQWWWWSDWTTEGGNRDLRWKEWSLGARLLGFGCKNLR